MNIRKKISFFCLGILFSCTPSKRVPQQVGDTEKLWFPIVRSSVGPIYMCVQYTPLVPKKYLFEKYASTLFCVEK